LWFSGLEGPLAAPEPTKIQSKITLEDQTSTILIPVSGSLRVFENILNKDVPWRLVDINEPQKTCVKTRSKLLPRITCRLVGHVKSGRIKLTGSGQNLKISIPISTTIQAQNIGVIIKRQTATGSMVVVLNAKLGLRKDWRPTAKINADYRWGTKMGINVLGQRIDLSARVDPEIRKVIAQIERRLPQLIRTLSARKKAQAIWARGFTSARAKSSPEIWVRFTPQQLGFAGYTVRNRQFIVNLAARAQAETIFGSRPKDPVVTPLPDLMASLPRTGIDVQVPVHIPYSVFREPVAQALQLGQWQTVKMQDGTPVQARFNDIEVFGTEGGKIAIGIGLTIEEPITWLGNVEGKIWIVARPRLDLGNKVVGISNLTVISRTNSKIFNTLVGAVSKDEIDKEFIQKIAYDFSQDYDDGIRKADDWLKAEPLEGFVFRGSLISADVLRMHILPDGLIVQARAKGDGRMTYAPNEAARLIAERRKRRTAKEQNKAVLPQIN
jgi:hypothetical protein